MLSPADILAAAERKWPAVLRAEAKGQEIFPIRIPFGQPKASEDFAVLKRDIEALAAAQLPWTIEWQSVNTRKWGRQDRWPVRVTFESANSLAAALGRCDELHAVRSALRLTRELCPALEPWLLHQAHRIPSHFKVWPELLSVCRYFDEHPQPNCFARQVPLPIGTKFIEEHAGLLRELLDVVLGGRVNGQAASFAERFHLKIDSPQIRFRLLDVTLQRQTGWPVADCTISLPAFSELNWSVKRTLIVENRDVFLCLPEVSGTVAVFGSGKAALMLSACEWMRTTDLVYWGDCDEAGFGILSSLRASFPNLKSLLMDEDAWVRWGHLATPGRRDPTSSHTHLTGSEHSALRAVLDGPLMLEQERIPPAVAADAIARAFAI